MTANTSYVLGVGNTMMTDDGIGPVIIELLSESQASLDFGLVDVGGDALKVLHYLDASIDRLLVVDTAKMGLTAGEFQLFSPEEVTTTKEVGTFSTHSGDVLKIIEMGRRLGYKIPRIRIMGIEPESLKEGMEISAKLRENLDHYIRAIKSEMMREW